MAKVIYLNVLIITMWTLNAASIPIANENDEKHFDFNDNDQSKYAVSEDKTINNSDKKPFVLESNNQTHLGQQIKKSGRKKRDIIVSGRCPIGKVWKPRPYYCITCERYEELSGNDC